jgi:hypothetical protein
LARRQHGSGWHIFLCNLLLIMSPSLCHDRMPGYGTAFETGKKYSYDPQLSYNGFQKFDR